MSINLKTTGAGRYAFASAAGFCVTTGLGLWMASLIAVSFTAEEKFAAQTYDINPEIIDIDPPRTRTKLKPYKTVEIPPPPARLASQITDVPGVDTVTMEVNIPPFKLPDIKMSPVINVSDTDATPIIRPSPSMPSRAERSGHCKVVFDVSPEGSPFNVRTSYCSDNLFERPSIKAVQNWTFRPKSVGGRSVAMTGVQNQITFRLTDERGEIIPE